MEGGGSWCGKGSRWCRLPSLLLLGFSPHAELLIPLPPNMGELAEAKDEMLDNSSNNSSLNWRLHQELTVLLRPLKVAQSKWLAQHFPPVVGWYHDPLGLHDWHWVEWSFFNQKTLVNEHVSRQGMHIYSWSTACMNHHSSLWKFRFTAGFAILIIMAELLKLCLQLYRIQMTCL